MGGVRGSAGPYERVTMSIEHCCDLHIRTRKVVQTDALWHLHWRPSCEHPIRCSRRRVNVTLRSSTLEISKLLRGHVVQGSARLVLLGQLIRICQRLRQAEIRKLRAPQSDARL